MKASAPPDSDAAKKTVGTLKLNSDFRRAYMRGKSYTDPALVVYVIKNRAGLCRIGITTSKKIRNAVQRNRARRVIREAFRTLPGSVKPGYDLVFVARTKTVYRTSTQIREVIGRLLSLANVLEAA